MLIGNRAHVDAVNSKGLLISGERKETFRPQADIEVREIPEHALILLTTKAHNSAGAIESIRNLVRKDTVILVLQNGLGNEDTVRQLVGSEVKVLRGITTMAAEFLRPGEIRFWRGETIIEDDATAKKIAEILNDSGLKTTLSKKISQEIWGKLIINCVINPLTAIFRVRNREICSDTLKIVRHRIVSECIAVGKSQGMRFSAMLAQNLDKDISSYSNFSSMCQDVMKRKKTEIDFLNGRIVELGRKNNIPTPTNEMLVHMINFLEEKNGLSR
jgi:2-dehydropantoate 2-reductase